MLRTLRLVQNRSLRAGKLDPLFLETSKDSFPQFVLDEVLIHELIDLHNQRKAERRLTEARDEPNKRRRLGQQPLNLAHGSDRLIPKRGFDVGGGQFSFYSEVNIRQGNIKGYIKPLFKDVEISADRLPSGPKGNAV